MQEHDSKALAISQNFFYSVSFVLKAYYIHWEGVLPTELTSLKPGSV